MMKKRRIAVSVIMGAVLGVLCIVGVGMRIGYSGNEMYLFAMWYNRVVMGILIGLAYDVKLIDSDKNSIVRGLLLGLIVTSAITFTSEFKDWPSFFAGIAYGAIIDHVATRSE